MFNPCFHILEAMFVLRLSPVVSESCGSPFPHYRSAACGVVSLFRFLRFGLRACFFTLTYCIHQTQIRSHDFLRILVLLTFPRVGKPWNFLFLSSVFSASHRRPQLDDFDFPHLRMAKKSIFKLQPEVLLTPPTCL